MRAMMIEKLMLLAESSPKQRSSFSVRRTSLRTPASATFLGSPASSAAAIKSAMHSSPVPAASLPGLCAIAVNPLPNIFSKPALTWRTGRSGTVASQTTKLLSCIAICIMKLLGPIRHQCLAVGPRGRLKGWLSGR